jgi:nucleotide-binding universal stress UspA family protein
MKAIDALSRVQLRNILFATDFSHAAGTAIPYAATLAKRYGANLYVVHVRRPVNWMLTPPIIWQGVEEAARIDAEEHKKEILTSFPQVHPEVLIESGDLWPNLAATIEANDIDLLVIGTRGRTGVAKLFLGSAAEEILRKATCPVLTVGPHSTEGSKLGGEITKILFATGLNPPSMAAPYAISLAQEYQAGLILLHVVEPPEVADLSRCAELLRNLVPREAELWCVPEYVVECGNAAESILNLAVRRQVDLIVMGAHEPTGFPGAHTHLPITTAHKIVSYAPCPVLTVRA